MVLTESNKNTFFQYIKQLNPPVASYLELLLLTTIYHGLPSILARFRQEFIALKLPSLEGNRKMWSRFWQQSNFLAEHHSTVTYPIKQIKRSRKVSQC